MRQLISLISVIYASLIVLFSFFFPMTEPEEESDEDDEPYLHPSLASSLTKIEAVCFTQFTLFTCMSYINLFLKMHKRFLRSWKSFVFGVVRNVEDPCWTAH